MATQHLDGMTERERYHVRGAYGLGDQTTISSASRSTARPSPAIAPTSPDATSWRCASRISGEMPRAVEVMREVVRILPSQPLFRDNLALYLNYAGDFQQAEQEARAGEGQPMPYAMLAIAFAQLGQGQRAEAKQTYETLRRNPAARQVVFGVRPRRPRGVRGSLRRRGADPARRGGRRSGRRRHRFRCRQADVDRRGGAGARPQRRRNRQRPTKRSSTGRTSGRGSSPRVPSRKPATRTGPGRSSKRSTTSITRSRGPTRRSSRACSR